MEKNIKKRVCRLAAVLSAGLVVLFGYWFFLNPHGYWQKKKEALRNQQGMLGLRQDIGICLLSLKAEDGWRNVSRRGFTRA